MIHLNANVDRFSGTGYANTYEKYRPQPPSVVIDILTQLAQVNRPRLVVDLGSGTGLSTRMWADRADVVIGIEPSADMRRIAQAQTAAMPNAEHVRYQAGYSHETDLIDECADIVTCSQSLHWMEPTSTFAEVARILRPGRVFAAIDCDWPPTMNWQAEDAYIRLDEECEKIGESRGFYRGVKQWDKEGHLARMQSSGKFRYVKEIVAHHTEMGNAERLVGLLLSQGGVAGLLKNGMTEEEIGVPEFRALAQRTLGDELSPWYFSYRVRLSIK
ncbi:MAG: class I SAM-dependent methyltransferase [Chloroflexi bacterium]|nr:class I SAM-dependent methyltransferase [Chloroflexota bacterium]